MQNVCIYIKIYNSIVAEYRKCIQSMHFFLSFDLPPFLKSNLLMPIDQSFHHIHVNQIHVNYPLIKTHLAHHFKLLLY